MNGSGDPPRRGRRRAGGSLDDWMSAGRQLVDGVAGARPGSRPQARGTERRAGGRASLEGLGRWVENRIDWLLEGDDDWSEPWQERLDTGSEASRGRGGRPERWGPPAREPRTTPRTVPEPGTWGEPPTAAAAGAGRRQPLEAISRRVAPLLPPSRDTTRDGASDRGPDAGSPRRPAEVKPQPPTGLTAQPPAAGHRPQRPLPRSSRRQDRSGSP